MSHRLRWARSALVIGLALAAGTCTELPAAVDDGRVQLDVTLETPSEAFVGDTVEATAVVRDPEGNVVVDPPVSWVYYSPEMGPVVAEEPLRLGIIARRRGSLRIGIEVAPRHPFAAGSVTRATVPVILALSEFRFRDDSVRISSLGTAATVPLLARDHRDQPVETAGIFQIEAFGLESINASSPLDRGIVRIYPRANGIDTLVARVESCTGQCADTLVVRVEQVPADLEITHTGPATSLGDTVYLGARVVDADGYGVPGYTPAWTLLEPSDTLLARLQPQFEGPARLVALDNGVVEVVSTVAGLADTAAIPIQQVVRQMLVEAPDTLLPLGEADTARLVGLEDARSNPIPLDWLRSVEWTEWYGRGVLQITPIGDGRAAEVVGAAVGWDVVRLYVMVCGPIEALGCSSPGRGMLVRVVDPPSG